jgi:hypothetical protein
MRPAMALCVGVAVALLVTAACTNTDDDVASLAAQARAPSLDPGTPASPGDAAASTPALLASQRERTEALVQCLIDHSIPARVNDLPDGQSSLDIGGSGGAVAFVAVDGTSLYTDDAEAQELWDAASKEGRPLLWIGGVDRTEDYVACVEESGYTAPLNIPDPAVEQAVKQLQVDLNNDWIACARDNGFPGLADVPPPVIDGGVTGDPPAILPDSTSEDLLRDVLEQCPPLVEDRFRELADGQETGPKAAVFGANISFEGIQPDAIDGLSKDEFDRIAGLSAIVGEAMESQCMEILARLAAEGITYRGTARWCSL